MAYAPKKVKLLKNKHELSKLLKDLEAVTPVALANLVEIIESTDESVSPKMKMDCSLVLIELRIKVSDTISKDQITRVLADNKVNNSSHQLVSDGKNGYLPPVIDMETIQRVK